MRQYQKDIIDAICCKTIWGGSNTVVRTERNVTEAFYYGNKIAVVNHSTKTATFDNCGYNNASTSARINAVKKFCIDNNYMY